MVQIGIPFPAGGWESICSEVLLQNGKHHRKYCAYCPTFGENTLEHVCPKWLYKYFKDESLSKYQSLTASEESGRTIINSRKRGNHLMTSTIRKLCNNCNRVWSKRIVDDAMHILMNVQSGDTISGRDSTNIARQAVLFFINREFTDSPNQVTSYKTRRMFRTMNEIPSNFRVWVSFYDGEAYRFVWNQFSDYEKFRPFGTDFNILLKGFGRAIFVIGKLVFYVEIIEDYYDFSIRKFSFTKEIDNFTLINPGSGKSIIKRCEDKDFQKAAWMSIPEENRHGYMPIRAE